MLQNSILKTLRVLPTEIDRPNDLISNTSGRPNVWEMTGVTKHQSISKQGVRGTGGEWFKKRSLCVCRALILSLRRIEMGWTELNHKEQFFIVLPEESVYVSFLTAHHDSDRKGFYNETDSWVFYGQRILSFQDESPTSWTPRSLFSLFSSFFFFPLTILSPRCLCLHEFLSPLHSFCVPCWELSVKYLGWSKSTDTSASIYQLFAGWNATHTRHAPVHFMASHCVGEENVRSLLTILPSLLVVQSLSCPALCNPMDHSTSDSSVLHCLPVCSNLCPLNRRCSLTIASSVVPFSSCPQSFPASGTFPMSRLFASGGQSIGASASASVLGMNMQGWFPLGLTGLISL